MDHSKPHFVIIPLMAQGHMIPMADLALLLARRGARVSLITTPRNALRLKAGADLASASNLLLQLVQLPFPCSAAGLPDGCENVDLIPSENLFIPFFKSLRLLANPLKTFLRSQPLPPACIISDQCMPWTTEVARELNIPRFVFHGPSCFFLLCTRKLVEENMYERVVDAEERFLVPGVPQRIEVCKESARRFFDWPGMEDIMRDVEESEDAAEGFVLNTFWELEAWYVEEYARAVGKKVWAVGPVSVANDDLCWKVVRGDGSGGADYGGVLRWLDGREKGSVIFVSFGSIARTRFRQMVEIGLGLGCRTGFGCE